MVDSVNSELRRLVDNMFDTMDAASGIGLAAPQIGRLERLAVVSVDDTRLVVINPEIILREGSDRAEEGCLSIPEIFAQVERPARVIVRAQDIDLNWYEIDANELLGRCLQHEIDHLHGRLFTDHLSLLKRRGAMKNWEREKTRYPALLRVLPVGDLPPDKDSAESAGKPGSGEKSTQGSVNPGESHGDHGPGGPHGPRL